MKTTTLLVFIFCSAIIFFSAGVNSQGFTVGKSTNPATVTPAAIEKITNLSNVMYNLWYNYDAACDQRAVFAVAYLYMTANAKKLVQNGYFDDGNKMVQFISTFAGRFLTATDNWDRNNLAGVSAPWKVYFNTVLGGHSDVTQDLTIGMNAHINYDLAIAAFQEGYADSRWTKDYYRVNDLMEQVDVNVTHALGRYDPLFYNTDYLSTTYFNLSIAFVTSWRSSAYASAVAYQTASVLPVATTSTLMAANELAVAAAGQTMGIPYPYSTAESRHAYCAANHYPLEV